VDSEPDAPGAIGGEEAQAQLELVRRALVPEDRDAALTEGVYRFGARFLWVLNYLAENSEASDLAAQFAELRETSTTILARWFTGEQLTTRADEPERRAKAANALLSGLAPGEATGLGRLAATAILSLPADHPERDVQSARATLADYLEHCREAGDTDSVLRTIATMLHHEVLADHEAEALIAEGLEQVDRAEDPAGRWDFTTEAAGYWFLRAIAARDEDNSGDQSEFLASGRELLEPLLAARDREVTSEERGALLMLGLQLDVAGADADAAATYRRVVDSGPVDDGGVQRAILRETQLRLGLGEPQRVVEILPPLLPYLQQRYLTSVMDEDIADAGEELAKAALALAVAHAECGDWASAVQRVDMVKSLRLRYRGALRGSEAAPRLLELERKLHAVQRGIAADATAVDRAADPLGAELSAATSLIQAYQEARPALSDDLLMSPSVAEIASVLATDEVAVVLGMHWKGTIVALVAPGDVDEPRAAELVTEWTLGRWIGLFLGEDALDGWLMALAARHPREDQARSLATLLEGVEEALGGRLARMAAAAGARRLVVVPHLILHLVPFWAVPSLQDLEVSMAPSAAQLVLARRVPAGRVEGRALVVSNPTGDLPLSPAETGAVARSLAPLGLDVDILEGADAREERVTAALAGASVFHFSGHGRSEMLEPTRSALLLHPDDERVGETDALGRMAEEVADWTVRPTEDDDPTVERWADLPGVGRLRERSVGDGLLERWLESGPTSTLWALYEEQRGRLLQIAELWSAGDMMVSGALEGCRLAFLSACESGAGGASPTIDEYAGLPAALHFFGAETLVCTIWPVSEALAAVYSELFYEALAASSGRVNVTALVRGAAQRVRTMDASEARSRIDGLATGTQDPVARMYLEAFAARLPERGAHPFSEPVDWAAFHALGGGELLLEEVG
jgi:CHAT domain